MTRRDFLHLTAGTVFLPPGLLPAAGTAPTTSLPDRIRGLIYGSALGDAFGGPIEFQPRESVARLSHPPKAWRDDEVLDDAARRATLDRLILRDYSALRPEPESYGQWNTRARPGTVTDDTRHKLVLLHALREAEEKNQWPLTTAGLARAYLNWPAQPAIAARPAYATLAADWLEEWQFAARWILGERDLSKARPPERMWQSLPTCCGQMTLPPLACLYPGRPEAAYRAAWDLAFFDNGFGRDMNAALVAALAQALVVPIDPEESRRAWEVILATLRGTDPFHFGRIRWSQRAVHRWLDFALDAARSAHGRPARFFARLEREFQHTTKWEAQVPFAAVFGCLELADYDPLVALQLSMEWGHDTDSYAQLLGAFIGAVHGISLFREEWRNAVAGSLREDFAFDLDGECGRLMRLARRGESRTLVAEA